MTPPRTPSLPPERRRQIDAELRVGEHVVWAGEPSPGLYARRSIGIVLFGIPWTAFAVFWVAMAGASAWFSHSAVFGVFWLFPLFGVPFVLVGVGMLTSPVWMRRTATRTVYAVTDQRAITIAGRTFGGVQVQSFLPERLTSMTRKQRADGSGDLIFEQFQQTAGSGTTTVRRGFMAIADVKAVEDLITATLLAGRARAV